MDEIGLIGRIAERLIVVSGGFASLAMGWNLFRAGVLETQSASAAAGEYKINLKAVAPGTFFALFGAGILCTSLLSPFEYTARDLPAGLAEASPTITEQIRFANQQQHQLRETIAALNTVIEVMYPGGDEPIHPTDMADVSASTSYLAIHRRSLLVPILGSSALDIWDRQGEAFRRDPISASEADREVLKGVQEWMDLRIESER